MKKIVLCAVLTALAGTVCAQSSPESFDTTNYLWSISAEGPRRSADQGASWQPALGTGDGVLEAGLTYASILKVGNTGLSFYPMANRTVLVGTTTGLYRTIDNGSHWYKVSGHGSGLEGTSQIASALLATNTAYGSIDLLVGMTGSTNGGVYLSGDGGLHWLQINQGFDPNNLSISSLIKTSCTGCPVTYYTGSYGGGVYTRTITVNAPPQITGWCFGSADCACSTEPMPSGSVLGGQSFKLCGQNFQSGSMASFGWSGNPFYALSSAPGVYETSGEAASRGCVGSSTQLFCEGTGANRCGGTSVVFGTPRHDEGTFFVALRNPDTRVGFLPTQYSFTPAPQY